MTAVELFDTILETPTLAATRILYTAGSKVTVNAPASHVWAILLDFPKYGDWNRDTPKMHLADGETLVVGSKPLMKIKMSAQGNREYDIPINVCPFPSFCFHEPAASDFEIRSLSSKEIHQRTSRTYSHGEEKCFRHGSLPLNACKQLRR